MVQPTFIQDIATRTSALEEGRQGSLQLAQILGPVSLGATVLNLQMVNARLKPMADRVIEAVLIAAQAPSDVSPYFALVQPVRAGRGSFWVITGFILRSAITPNPTTPD